MEFDGLLTTTVFLPLASAVLMALLLKSAVVIRRFSLLIGFIQLILTIVVFTSYDSSLEAPQFQLIDKLSNWIPIESFRVEYFLGVDGLSAPLVLLTGILGLVSILASWGNSYRVKEYFFWLLALQTGVMGVFTSLDFIQFFLFWELELIPMFFLIAVWGSGRKEYSAMKFLIFTFLGSAFMLIGILIIHYSIHPHTFDMTLIPTAIKSTTLLLPPMVVFFLLFVGFAVKLPVWPLHTWLPDAHTDAPTAGSVMLAGVLLKMGGYGMVRVSATMFPGVMTDIGWLIIVLGVVNVLYGAAVTVRQTDLKRLIAFSSISHMGFVLIGLSSVVGIGGTVSSTGLTGAAFQMFTHGTITGLMFLVVGYIYEKADTRYIPDLGGLASKMPILATAFLVAGLASLGIPGTSGFVSEILIFLGTFGVWSWLTAMGAFGIVLTAGYILWMIQRSLFGPAISRFESVKDASAIEVVPIAILVFLIIGIGIYPAIITDVFTSGVEPIIESFNEVSSTRLNQ